MNLRLGCEINVIMHSGRKMCTSALDPFVQADSTEFPTMPTFIRQCYCCTTQLTSIFVSVHSLIDFSPLPEKIDRSPLKVIFNIRLNRIVKAKKGTRLTSFLLGFFLHVYCALNYEWLSGALLSCALIIHSELWVKKRDHHQRAVLSPKSHHFSQQWLCCGGKKETQ